MRVLNQSQQNTLADVFERWIYHELFWRAEARSVHVGKFELLYHAPEAIR